jgi:hypothetical protein
MYMRVTLDKGPGTNLKQIEPWIAPFFILKKHFKKGTMSESTGLGSNIKKYVIDMWED